jgi:hypothetical protein
MSTEDERLQLAHHIIQLMNSALILDREAIDALVKRRVVCNADLAQHPTIQVRTGSAAPTLGLVGLLNGIVGVDEQGNGYIAADFDSATDKLLWFSLNHNLHKSSK